MSHDPDRKSHLHKHHLDIPARWTDDQPNFLRFSFPSSPTISPTPRATTPSPSPAKLERIQRGLRSHRWGNRHFAISGIFSGLQTNWPTSRNLTLRFGGNSQSLDCVVSSPADGDGEETPTLAYADQRHIEYQRHLAETPYQRQTMNRDHVEPYITALLISVAQAQDGRSRDASITSSVLYTRNQKAPATDDLEEIHIYTARIPHSLLEFFRRPKANLPPYDPILVSWVSMPLKPLESLRECVSVTIRDRELGRLTQEEADDG